jgi:DNA-binding MarR family transcriptional regulator
MGKIETSNWASEFFELARLYNLHGKFAGGVYNTELSPLEAYIILEIDINPNSSINEIAKILGAERSTVSRAMTRLEKSDYVSYKNSEIDKRRKDLYLTNKGSDFLLIHDQFNNRLIKELSRGLNHFELSELSGYLTYWAEKDGALPLKLRKGENSLLKGVRGLARSWNAIGDSFLGTKYSVLHWQILTELTLHDEGIRPSVFAEQLGLKRNTLSQIINRFEQVGLVKRNVDSSDGRGFLLSITTKGQDVLKEIQKAGASRIEKSLGELSPAKREEFLSLWRRYVSKVEESIIVDHSLVLQPRITLQGVLDEEFRDRVRKWLIKQYSISDFFVPPDRLLANDSSSWVALEEENIVGFVEVSYLIGQSIVRQDIKIINFVWLLESQTLAKKFLKESLSIVVKDRSIKRVKIDSRSYLQVILGLSKNPIDEIELERLLVFLN